jgi:hypothetical protein
VRPDVVPDGRGGGGGGGAPQAAQAGDNAEAAASWEPSARPGSSSWQQHQDSGSSSWQHQDSSSPRTPRRAEGLRAEVVSISDVRLEAKDDGTPSRLSVNNSSGNSGGHKEMSSILADQ